ncbi:DUF1488 domain-containing protein [Vibrio sp. SS-MA-C1-2]|uniref:DUF1488 family protein n=1 Tax=Vibrio sp. SS-MA-C1-2 TaxID=2908646 RepID=UPI001F30BCCF|nr:DUF1488 family protein [Vibrio sp. SS-MA-C1-2]UJF19364.1 DUF1488 domain-containing protein [Vibrio sp. SS-MA-C1-2]
MNQSILFSDDYRCLPNLKAINVTAHQGGYQIDCFVSFAWLFSTSSGIDHSESDESQILICFKALWFDIEEELENLIEDESFNSKGEIWL